MGTKLVIPIILSITILVAGIFAFVPVQQATGVHFIIIDAMILAIQNTVPIAFIPLADDHDNIDGNLTEIDTALSNLDINLDGNFTDILGNITDVHDWVMTGHDNIDGNITQLHGNHTFILGNLTDIDTALSNLDINLDGNFTDILGNVTDGHDTILANNLKFSVVTGTADDADDVVTITCPATSEGCLILDVLFDNNGGADLVIDDASVTIDAFTGDPSFDVFTADVTIADGVTQYLDEVSGVSLGAGDILVITPTGGSTSDDWSVQVIANIQGDVADVGIDVS